MSNGDQNDDKNRSALLKNENQPTIKVRPIYYQAIKEISVLINASVNNDDHAPPPLVLLAIDRIVCIAIDDLVPC